MDKNEPLSFVSLTPNQEETEKYEQEVLLLKKKERRKRKILPILFLVSSGILIVNNCIRYAEYKTELRQFEEKLTAAISEQYEEVVWNDDFGLKKDGEYVDSLCLIETGEKLDLVEIVTNDRGKTFDVFMVIEDIEPDVYYCTKAPCSDYYFGFVVSSNEPATGPIYYSVELQWNNKTYWFYIDYLETTPKG